MKPLFKERLLQEWSNKKKTWNSIFDWTILLYIVIPGIIIFILFYKDYFQHVQDYWIANVHLSFIIFILLYLTQLDCIRTYLQPADRLFYIQNQQQLYELKKAGFIWTMCKQIIKILITFFLLYPLLLLVHHFQIVDFLSLASIIMLSSFISGIIHLEVLSKWISFLLLMLIFAFCTYIFLTITPLILLFITIFLLVLLSIFYKKRYLKEIKYFERELVLEMKAFYKWQSTVFQLSLELRSMKEPKLSKPRFILTKSKPLFQREDFALEELIIKTIIRHSDYKWGYLRLIGMTIPLYIFLPTWADFVVLGLLYLMLKSWLNSVFYQLHEHKIFTVISLTKQQWEITNKRITKWLVNSVILAIGLSLVICLIITM